ncbi:MAG: RluA family pseudouridine synthase [Bacteroidetes bacterium]|nr:RluA family pseudouridine synthase [Bacteroidota bacterium]MBU1579115.1 RluA family pseudouridine synthase [Bacteroidota bacterium]MBU2464705.1 RluA family pseudouridine synthase [Bacteroidota bacterium]MBU2558214.1 RluA family pseudouridine synthase [Bacteroidota bacterium]
MQLESLKDRILFEDNHLLLINKLPSELVQGDKTGDKCLLDYASDYLKQTYNKPGEAFVGLVHRIDRPVSGVLLLTKTSKALSRLSMQLKNHEWQKIYLAIVKKEPPKKNDMLSHFLAKNEKQNKSYVVKPAAKNAKEARLSYRLLGKSDQYFLLEVTLHTGRHHQIRAQLAAIGSPIKGDLKYGFDRSNPDGSISLHAWKLSFVHPVTKESLLISAPPPSGQPWEFFSKLL